MQCSMPAPARKAATVSSSSPPVAWHWYSKRPFSAFAVAAMLRYRSRVIVLVVVGGAGLVQDRVHVVPELGRAFFSISRPRPCPSAAVVPIIIWRLPARQATAVALLQFTKVSPRCPGRCCGSPNCGRRC